METTVQINNKKRKYQNEFILERFNILPITIQAQVLDYIDFLSTKYAEDLQSKTIQNLEDEISPEIKELLKNRIEDHKQNTQNAVTWDEVEKQYEKEYGYEIKLKNKHF